MPYDPTTTLKALEALMPADTVLEMRAFRSRFSSGFIVPAEYNTTLSGWYNKPHDLSVDANRARETSLYLTFNPVDPDLLARSYNKMTKSTSATKDEDIIALRWLYIDIDPIRKPDISATDEERAIALGRRDAIFAAFPGLANCSLSGSSGNGAYILARIPDLANTDENRELIATATKIFGHLYSDEKAEIDQKTKNPSRVFCLPGSMKCKGSNVPNRPHRAVTVDDVPVAGLTFDLASFVAEHAERLPKESARVSRSVPSSPVAGASASRTEPYTDMGAMGAKIYRASRYLGSMAPAVAGQGGHNQTFDAACTLVKGFDFSPTEAYPILAEWNQRCDPPWEPHDLQHKLDEADSRPDDKPRGYLLDSPKPAGSGHPQGEEGDEEGDEGEAGDEMVFRPGYEDNPRELAYYYLRKQQNHPDGYTMRFWQDEFWAWTRGAYRPVSKSEMRAMLSEVIADHFENVHHAQLIASAMGGGDRQQPPKPLAVTTNLTGHVYQAISGITVLRAFDYPAQPCWLDGGDPWNPAEILPMRNSIVHLPSYLDGKPCTRRPTPKLFCPYVLNYDWDANAPTPERWLAFLGQLWPDDPESIQFLQEWMGLQLVPDTSFEKIAAFIGPPRAGKGVIASIIRSMIGPDNCAGPTLSSLGIDFGLESLIGKLAAIIDDARLSGKVDQAVITERLLSISGQGSLTIQRKYKAGMELVLPTRITLISNEPPRLIDKSGALPNRFIILKFNRSFLGHEDPTLKASLQAELPGILLWAIEGWKRLKERGRFIAPESGKDVHEEMEDMASPIATFVRDCCIVHPDEVTAKADLYAAWKGWCERNGKKEAGELSVFGRDLRTVCPELRNVQPQNGGKRVTSYRGIGLLPPSELFGSPEEPASPEEPGEVGYTDENGNWLAF